MKPHCECPAYNSRQNCWRNTCMGVAGALCSVSSASLSQMRAMSIKMSRTRKFTAPPQYRSGNHQGAKSRSNARAKAGYRPTKPLVLVGPAINPQNPILGMRRLREKSSLSVLRLPHAKLSRNFNQVARGRIRRFESYMPSHAVRLPTRPPILKAGSS